MSQSGEIVKAELMHHSRGLGLEYEKRSDGSLGSNPHIPSTQRMSPLCFKAVSYHREEILKMCLKLY